jgi:hypothetical protein
MPGLRDKKSWGLVGPETRLCTGGSVKVPAGDSPFFFLGPVRAERVWQGLLVSGMEDSFAARTLRAGLKLCVPMGD